MISVIIPIFNGEKLLFRCLKSIERQSYPDFECIMVNDGSKDATAQICTSYTQKDARFIYLYQENGGVSSARNRGLDNRKGEYVAFIDADDYIEENYLEKLLAALKLTGSDICYCHACDIEENGSICKDRTGTVFDASHRVLSRKEYSWLDCQDGHFTVWGGVIRSSLFTGLRFSEDLAVGEDTLLLAQLIKKSGRICSLHERLYYYSIVENSTFHSPFSAKRYDEIIAWKRICDLYENGNDSLTAYAYRIQSIWKRYQRDLAFDKKFSEDLNRRYQEIKPGLIRAFIRKGKWTRALRVSCYSILLKLTAIRT